MSKHAIKHSFIQLKAVRITMYEEKKLVLHNNSVIRKSTKPVFLGFEMLGISKNFKLQKSHNRPSSCRRKTLHFPNCQSNLEVVQRPPLFGTVKLQYSALRQKICKTLDRRSTLICAANCTEQKLSSSESYYLTPNLEGRNQACFVALLFSRTPTWRRFGLWPTSLYDTTIQIRTFCWSLPSVQSVLTVPCVVTLLL